MRDDLTIVIVSFNSGQTILDVLGGLLVDPPCRTIIVDNASMDDSAGLLAEELPNVELIVAEVNLGYGSAANRGLAISSTEYVLLLNPDVRLDQAALFQIVTAMKSMPEDVAMCAPALPGSDQAGNGAVEVDSLTGAFLLCRMSVMKQTGFFDENIFLFYEKEDLVMRLRANGHRLMLLSDTYVDRPDRGNGSRKTAISYLRNWHVAWSSLYYFHKHGVMKGRRKAVKLTRKYFYKSLLHFNTEKRIKYNARYLGCKAWLEGESAFNKNGSGKLSEIVSRRPDDL